MTTLSWIVGLRVHNLPHRECGCGQQRHFLQRAECIVEPVLTKDSAQIVYFRLLCPGHNDNSNKDITLAV